MIRGWTATGLAPLMKACAGSWRVACLVVPALISFAAPVRAADDPGDLDRYVGRYSESLGSQAVIEVTHEDGILFFQPSGQSRSGSTLKDNGAFQLDNAPIEVVFQESVEGDIEVLTFEQGGQTRRMTRVEVLEAVYESEATEVRPNGLSDAVLQSDLASARALIEQGIDVDELDTRLEVAGPNGRRPLNWAALQNDVAMIELLLDAGADIHGTNRSGFAPIHHAAEANAADAAALLIERGANLQQMTSQGLTPIDVAVAGNAVAVFQVLQTALNIENCGQEACTQSRQVADVAHLIERLDMDIPGYLSQSNTPGAAVAVIQNGEIVVTKGYGLADVADTIAVTPETGFNVGSISKTIAAWGVMTLVEQGQLDLDEPVSTYLTRWRLPESEFDETGVTLRRLLSHTAGLSLHGYPGWGPDDELPTVEESLSGKTNGAGPVELIMEPGTQWKYSGGGYTLAQLIIEEATGLTFEDYVRDAVLRPLGMSNSDFHLSDELMARSSIAHDQQGQPTPNPRFTAQAAAGLHTTVEDLASFAAAALATGSGQEPGRGVLSPSTVEMMMTPAAASNDTYGLGYGARLMASGHQGWGHGGANRGWIAYYVVVPDTGDGIVVLTNGSNGGAVHEPIVRTWDRWLSGRSL